MIKRYTNSRLRHLLYLTSVSFWTHIYCRVSNYISSHLVSYYTDFNE